MLLELNECRNIQSSVLATGIIYGKENSELMGQVIAALDGQRLSVYGNGENTLSLTSLESLL